MVAQGGGVQPHGSASDLAQLAEEHAEIEATIACLRRWHSVSMAALGPNSVEMAWALLTRKVALKAKKANLQAHMH